MNAKTRLSPGDTIGILGGGQLGRMLAQSAASLGLKTHIFCPDPNSPAFDVSATFTVAPYEDIDALDRFASSVDAVTYEFENVPGPTAAHLDAKVPVRPGVRALEVSQDRLFEKQFLSGAGVAIADFADIASQQDLEEAVTRFGGKGVLKTRRFGYDGKGQQMIRKPEDADGAFEKLGAVPMVLEALIPFECEVSVIVARDLDGGIACYDVARNHHENHILKTSTVPAGVSQATLDAARAMAGKIVAGLDYVGVMGVEMFLVREAAGERLLVNEIAPRVHNSGHWTQDACLTSQFDQHIRAVAGWPLGSAERHSDAVMENLIGFDADSWHEVLKEPAARLHLYGKAETREGRKMGHVNRISEKS
ncbi:MAG: 5-(carboxyamino)imidazole ribonucleotide synthase [Pseudomonadota bacterium]|jgi:5-(carboxyamino)imidazole ribonucleotide synthase|uniref:5-(carboxyamino)imidazole ribonucleotide synthase n=1 Tax=Roseibium sp. TaxID=1936156 RepID=UPI002E876A61|nr:5-(carboxyamino)imidazole ribonucleotide synthase [Pseudomonadota bacterium]MEC9470429.1 5-(carboxyamino)imidazole ribonucleotide synthase [Pseudomonadota bacterium]MEE2863874.1 5-(carboxyamino)imidazole ribonucleotide synthase [Pseudomonadota bacterium]